MKEKEEGIKVETPKAEVKPAEEKKIKIIIDEQEGDENSGDVFVSVNGKAFQIKRGFPVDVPESVVTVLKDAITTKMTQNLQTGEFYYKDVPRFSFHVVN